MPIHYDKRNRRYRFTFNRVIENRRYRTSRLLPQGWSKAHADAYDLKETARFYALASGVIKQAPSIEYAVQLYLEHYAPSLRNFEDIRNALAQCFYAYTGKSIDELPSISRSYAADMAGSISPATVRNRLAYLRSACRYAWKAHGLGEHDPAERMVLPRVKNARKEYASRAQMLTICRVMSNRNARACVRICFYSGMRISEALAAEPHADYWFLADSKNGEARPVPIHPKTAHLRDHWPPAIRADTVSKLFKKAAISVGLGHLRLHDMRHSAASEMINAGIDLYTVGQVLGHKSPVSTQRYSHLYLETRKKAIESIGRKMPTTKHPKAA